MRRVDRVKRLVERHEREPDHGREQRGPARGRDRALAARGRDDRVSFIKESVQDLKGIEVLPFDTLLTDFAESHKANIIIKGLRAVSDFEYELQMGLMNRNLNDNLETVFMIPSQEYSFLSSSFVKEIAKHGGDVSKMVPKCVHEEILEIPS